MPLVAGELIVTIADQSDSPSGDREPGRYSRTGLGRAGKPVSWAEAIVARSSSVTQSDLVSEVAGAKGRLLVVEDDNIVALELRNRLQDMGYAVLGVCSSGEDAVTKADSLRPDLVLMDIRLRGVMDGTEAAEAIRTRFDLPVVYLTAFADEDTLRRAKLTEPYGYIIKPFDETGLQAAIEVALHKHQSERRLRQSERWLATTLRSIGDAVITADEHGTVTFLNPRAEALTGWPEVQAVGRDLTEVFRVRDAATGLSRGGYLLRAFEQDVHTVPPVDPVLVARDGREIPIDDTVAPIQDGSGRVVGLVLVFRDVAARRLGEDGLQRFEREKIAALDAMSELVVYSDMEGRVIWTNRAVSDAVGCSSGQLVGHQCYRTWPQRDRPCPDCPARRARDSRRPEEAEIYSPDGRVWLVRCYPVADARGDLVGTVEVILEITARYQMEQERERLQAQLLEAQKMEAVGRLASGVAHDFNNYLTVIMGNGQFLLGGLEEDDPRRIDSQEILKAARRAASVTRQLLAFSRPQMLEPRVVDLNELVVNLEKMLERLIGEDVTLLTALAPTLDRIRADPGQIEQVLMNLALNARDAMPRGGILTIKTENAVLTEQDCGSTAEVSPGRFVCLSVTDTGVGMDEDVLAHIFEPYFTTKRVGEGTGLGLSVVYGIVQKHQGWIRVQSQPGQGSTFKVYVPPALGDAPWEEGREEDLPLGVGLGCGEGILLVEDDRRVRRYVARLLKRRGYAVFEAGDAREAHEVFDQQKERVDLVFSDVVLPDGTGLRLVEELLSTKGDLAVLLGSGYWDDRARRAEVQERGFNFVQKPYTSAQLLRSVSEALDL